ncbi:hypothetical protein B0T20DRAFT_487838 [Sordaria brevicollis]|uniref:Uncharacterized protein n=1 Tax=Sordaria brevicollis TaxID=83679 RepID=A0AAE0P3G9_SORBR|nr:hypothetical protein B0T20DRAFT_487838 [Sordaria brevicollis]
MDGGRKRSRPDDLWESLHGPPLKRLRAGNGSGVPRGPGYEVQIWGQEANADEQQHGSASSPHAQQQPSSPPLPTPVSQSTHTEDEVDDGDETDDDVSDSDNDNDNENDNVVDDEMMQAAVTLQLLTEANDYLAQLLSALAGEDGNVDNANDNDNVVSGTSSVTGPGEPDSETADDTSDAATDASESDLDIGYDDWDAMYPLDMFQEPEPGFAVVVHLAEEEQMQILQEQQEEIAPEQGPPQAEQVPVQAGLDLDDEDEDELIQTILVQANHQDLFAWQQAAVQLATPPSSPPLP